MTERHKYASGTEWEPIVGYSRAIRVGASIWVSGTTATDGTGRVVGVGDVVVQTRQVLRNVETALHALGGALEHVVRTRIYVVDIGDWRKVGEVHGEFFREVRPATSMVEVRRLIAPEILVEIEAEACVP